MRLMTARWREAIVESPSIHDFELSFWLFLVFKNTLFSINDHVHRRNPFVLLVGSANKAASLTPDS